MTIEFSPWPKIARLNRDITVTEKIDGTNGAIGIAEVDLFELTVGDIRNAVVIEHTDGSSMATIVYAQSRKQLITPDRDNYGFARYVWDNAEQLAAVLGPGLHFGEWWGSGIQRGYGLPKDEKRFSLFNTKRWSGLAGSEYALWPQRLRVVPVLYEGPFDNGFNGQDELAESWSPWKQALYELEKDGSAAAPGFMNPEGVVIYHHAANSCFKVTIHGDEAPKGLTR